MLKAVCVEQFDFYAPLYEPLRIKLARSPVKYRAELTSLLQPSHSLIQHFRSAVSGSYDGAREVVSQYDGALEEFFARPEPISRTVLRQLGEDDGHEHFPDCFHKFSSPKPVLALQCLPGDMESFWVEMLQRPVPNAAMASAQLAATSYSQHPWSTDS